MDRKIKKYKSDTHINVMSVLSIIFSLLTVAPSFPMLIIMAYVPLICSILFLVTKFPLFGVICTFFFFMNRIGGFEDLLYDFLFLVILLAITAYFIYVNYLSILDWKERKEDGKQSK